MDPWWCQVFRDGPVEDWRVGVPPLPLQLPDSEPPTPHGTHWNCTRKISIFLYTSKFHYLKLCEESGVKSWKNAGSPVVYYLWGLNDASYYQEPEWRNSRQSARVTKKQTHSVRRQQSCEILRNPKSPQMHLIHCPCLFMTTRSTRTHCIKSSQKTLQMYPQTQPLRKLNHLSFICWLTYLGGRLMS